MVNYTLPLFYNCYFLRQVGGAVVIFEVQRSARSEARKEEARKQELEVKLQADSSLSPWLLICNPQQVHFSTYGGSCIL